MTPACLGFVICLGIAILVVKKEYVIVPLAIGMCFVPADVSFQLATLDFRALRIIAVFGLIRIACDPKKDFISYNTIDKLFYSYHLLGAVIYVVASFNTFGAIIYKSGQLVDSLAIYWILRYALQNKSAVRLSVKVLAICIVTLLPFAFLEFFTAKNLFSIFGRDAISIRNGEIRAACTFSHSILFGSFAAAVFPVFWGEFKCEKRNLFLVAMVCTFFFIFACSSSGPIVAIIGTIACLVFFKWKSFSKKITYFLFASLVFIHFIREAPLWNLIYMRINVKASSTGFHRYLLTEAAIKEFWNWWLFGYGDTGPQWHVKYWSWTHATFTDVTNHYLLEGVRGGFFTMVLFILLCIKVVRILGTYSIKQNTKSDQWLWWGWMVMMVTHCATFLSVAYFGQITMLLYLTIAVAAYVLDQENSKQNQILVKV